MINDSFCYILASRKNGALYTGVTSNLVRCVYGHKTGTSSLHSAKYNIKQLVWFEGYASITNAIRREKRLKKYPRQWKVNLIEEKNPMWRDLYMEICR